jgi:crossover junction endodeoxyribonuclease RusA
MLPLEFIVAGPPVSHQSHNAENLHAWRLRVRDAARQRWTAASPIASTRLKMTVVYYHERETVRIDNDNMVKPIQDALIGLVYEDDGQITDTQVRRSNIDGTFRVRRMSEVLAAGFIRGEPFLYIRIEEAPSHEELL